MVHLRWFKMSLNLILLLQFTAATRQLFSSLVGVGDEVTLSCENVIDGQKKCESTAWLFGKSTSTPSVVLVNLGQIVEKAKAKLDRLSVTEKCSLAIKNVTAEDVGLYHCQQCTSQQQCEDTQLGLSVINMRKHEDGEQVMLSCSVSTHEPCRHTLKWLYKSENADEDIRYTKMEASRSECSVTVMFPISYLKQKPKYHELFKCKMTDGYIKEVKLFDFSPQSSGEKPGKDAPTATSTTRPTESSTQSRTNSTAPAVSVTTPLSWWLYIIVAVGLLALLMIIVAVVKLKQTKGNKTQMDDNAGQSLNPAVTQPGPDTADPEDGVCYASISYTKKTNSKAQVQVKNVGDEGDSVTYSTVKASSSSTAGASADPSNLYATINKPHK